MRPGKEIPKNPKANPVNEASHDSVLCTKVPLRLAADTALHNHNSYNDKKKKRTVNQEHDSNQNQNTTGNHSNRSCIPI